MPLYIVLFHTSTETVRREYPAPNPQACLDIAEGQFRRWNADHGELHEVVVYPPNGQAYFDSTDFPDKVLEFYRLTPEGRRLMDEIAVRAHRRR